MIPSQELGRTTDLQVAIEAFLKELWMANRSEHTLRAYRTDLGQLAAFHLEPISTLDADLLRTFFNSFAHLTPATRSRKQASLSSFLKWAVQQELIDHNPVDRITRVQPDPPAPRPVSRQEAEAVLNSVPTSRLRDRLLFTLLFETGMRIGEALALYVDDLDLTPDDERMTVLGKGKRRRTILLDDPALVNLLKRYLRKHRYQHGPLFRAHKNSRGGPISYQAAQQLWAKYCKQVGVTCSLHQLRHAHATELINDGVSLATIRKRLGHKNMQTTLRYAEQSDEVADAELRARRRRKS
jgi:site-specific recombinase XerD